MERVGKYQLVRKLATGGMAEVFLARAEGPGGFSKKLVVKRILPHFVSDPTFANMFLSEARLAAELNHPNVVQIFDFGQADGQYYLAMEYIDGANLRVLNTAATTAGVRIPFPLAARLASLAAEGLHFAHELHGEDGKHIGLVHRDISPDNILVSRSGAVKVVDFGIAKANAQPSMTRSGVIKGKMAYMPPEQLGRKPVDRRVDIFALGVVLHELVTGTWPFDASSEVSIIQAIMNEVPFTHVRERRSDVPEALDTIIARCLEKNRDLRYATCKELHADLEQYISSTGQAVTATDLADLVNRLVPSSTTNPDQVSPSSSDDVSLDRTFKRDVSDSDALAKAGAESSMKTQLPEAPRKSAAPLVVIAVLAAAAISAGIAWWVNRPPPPVFVVDPPPQTIDAGAMVVASAIAVDAGASAPDDFDAGAVAVVVAPPVAVDAGVPVRPVERPASPRSVKIEFRIRPFAQVFLDGKDIGTTPMPPVSVGVGKHKLRLVGKSREKELEYEFHAGDSIFKYNLEE